MKLKERIYAIRHMFMPGHTLGAVIKQHNKYDVNSEEMNLLLKQFTELNGSAVFKAGASCLVPILAKHLSSPQETP